MGSHLLVLTDGEGYDLLCCAIVLPTSHLLGLSSVFSELYIASISL